MMCFPGCSGSASSTAASKASGDRDVVRRCGKSPWPENGMSHPDTSTESPSCTRSATPSRTYSMAPRRTSTTTSIGMGSESKL